MLNELFSKNLPSFFFTIVIGACIYVGVPPTASAAPSEVVKSGSTLGAPPALFRTPLTNDQPQGDASETFVRDQQVVRWRTVDIDFSVLTAMADSANGTDAIRKAISLNFFDNATFIAVTDRIERTERGLSWIGHLRDVDMSQVVIVVNGDVVSGNITMPMARYHIRYAGSGKHEVQRIDQSLFPHDEPSVPVPNITAGKDSSLATNPSAQADDGSIIDVMVVYSATARAAAGGTAVIHAQIDAAIAETNQSYLNSGVAQKLRLVHTAEVAYNESGHSDLLDDALACITATADGCLDNIHTVRNTYGADLVSFWIEGDGQYCGLGWQMATVATSFESHGFNSVARSCAVNNYSFAHELGHNMGLMHDTFVDPAVKPYPYAHGYVNIPGAWRTIMAYNTACAEVGKNCERIQYWSNPAVSYGGAAMGNSTSADDHRALNNTASTVANFRASVGSSAATVVEFYNTNLDHYFITADSGEAGAIDNGSAGPGWMRTGGTFKSGGATQVCRFYGSQSPGPNSHFYTVDANECAALKNLQASTPITQKRWNFESLDFVSTPAVNQACAAGTVPVYRAYNNGYSRGVDSNHRITSSQSAIQEVVNRGWSSEGTVMCAPQ